MTVRFRSLALAALLAAGLALPALADDTHDLAPAHGGVVAESRHVVYELVAQPAAVRLYLRDHGKPAPVAGAGARLTLLVGTQKQEVELKPAGDRLEATGKFDVPAGTKAVAVVTREGKTIGTVRFTLK